MPALTPKSDGLTVAIMPQSSSVNCHSWKRDTAQFHLVESDDHMCIDWPEYYLMGDCSHVGLTQALLFESGTRRPVNSLASFQHSQYVR